MREEKNLRLAGLILGLGSAHEKKKRLGMSQFPPLAVDGAGGGRLEMTRAGMSSCVPPKWSHLHTLLGEIEGRTAHRRGEIRKRRWLCPECASNPRTCIDLQSQPITSSSTDRVEEGKEDIPHSKSHFAAWGAKGGSLCMHQRRKGRGEKRRDVARC